jgi:N utilization substance protein B
MLSALVEIRKKEIDFLEKSSKKHLATPEERNPNRKFVDNAILKTLDENRGLEAAIEKRKINNWTRNDDYIHLILADVKNSVLYKEYMAARKSTFEDDRQFAIDMFMELIAPNDKLYDYLEDHKLTWIDDIPLVNTQIVKQLRAVKSPADAFTVQPLFKDEEDRDFARDLLRRTVLNEPELAKEYTDKTPNWDTDRIAEIDTIILKMAICEFTRFPSIPVKVTINEYLELAKEYSTPKSSIFINGILDSLVKEFQQHNKLNKSGRGLL